MESINFDNLPSGNQFYDGAAKKISVVYQGKNYMLKFPSKATQQNELNIEYSHSSFSEDISCRLINALHIPGVTAQNTLLGESHGKVVVACEDFTTAQTQLVKFNMVQNADVDSDASGRHPYLQDILGTYATLPLLQTRPEFEERFWDTFVLDSFLGNFDRHSGNWGFLNTPKTGQLELAPIFDCGSCLYPALSEQRMSQVLTSDAEIDQRIYTFPLSAIKDKSTGAKINYAEFLQRTDNRQCKQALSRFEKCYDPAIITKVIDDTAYISSQRKLFYKVMLQQRYEKLIAPAIHRDHSRIL